MAEITKGSGTDLNRIWADTGSKSDPGPSHIAQGWIGEIPIAEEENYQRNKQDRFIAHLNQHGIPQWDNVTEYQASKSYIMGSNGIIYKCILTHTNKDPVSALDAATYWSVAFDPSGYAYSKAETTSQFLSKTSNLGDLQNISTARTNLGLGTAALTNTGTSSGNTMLVGAFGLGDTSSAFTAPSSNANSITANGLYTVGTSTLNTPVSSVGTILHINHSALHSTQIFIEAVSGRLFSRCKYNNVWQTWRGNFDSLNISSFIQTLLDDGDAASARNTLDVPSKTGVGASGNWNIAVAQLLQANTSVAMNFNWNGQGGQPTWVWGSTNGVDNYIYNPSNFSVNYANTSGNANTLGGYNASQLWRTDQSSFSATVPGHVLFPNGFKFVWGVHTVGSNASTFFNFSSGFTAVALGAMITYVNPGLSDSENGGYNYVNTSGIELKNGVNSSTTMFYIAWGI